MGQPTKLTPELQEAICNAIRLGVPIMRACERVEAPYPTVVEWIARGEGRHERKSTPLYADFALAIKKARADDQARRLARIEQAARGGAVTFRRTTTKPDGTVTVEERVSEPQWTADAWHLERSDPGHWARRDRTEHTGEGGGPVQLRMTLEVLARADRELEDWERERRNRAAGGNGHPSGSGVPS